MATIAEARNIFDEIAASEAAANPTAAIDVSTQNPFQTVLKDTAELRGEPPPGFEDPGAAMSLLIGAGRATDQLSKGVQQLYYGARDDKSALERLRREVESNDAAYAPLAKARPWSTGIGESAPELAFMLGSGGTGILGTMGRSAAAGAIPGALKYGDASDRAARALVGGLGGATGSALGMGANKLLFPPGMGTGVAASPSVLQAAQRIGYEPMPSQISQSPSLQGFENYLLRQPGSSGLMKAAGDAQQAAVNRAGARSMGENLREGISALDEDVFANAKARIGGNFDTLQAQTRINGLDRQGGNFLNTLDSLAQAQVDRAGFRNTAVDGLMDRAMDTAAQGRLSGTAYKEIRSQLTAEISASTDAVEQNALRRVRSALDDAANQSLTPEQQAAWAESRRQYKAYKTLSEKTVAEAGNVSPAKVASVVRRTEGDALRTGRLNGPLADIATIGEHFKPMANPTSGSQVAYQNALGPLAMLGNRAMAGTYLSPIGRRYFSRGLIDIGDTGRIATNRGAGLLGAPAALGLLGM